MRSGDLIDSGVKFDEAAHAYTYEGRRLRGVTPLVAWMYPDTYKDVDPATLRKAAERGSAIHEQCQMYNTIGITGEDYETQEYIRLLAERGLKPIEGEYIVSDRESLASAVDVVFEDGSLGDIKCTSEIHYENVALQLNIYRAWFEDMNLEAVPHLYVIWLPRRQYGSCTIAEVPVWEDWLVRDILEAYRRGGDPAPLRERIGRLHRQPTVIPQSVLAIEREYARIERLMERLKSRKERMAAAVLAAMREYGVKSWDTGAVRFTRLLPTKRKTLDSKMLKEKHPEAYEACLKETETKEGLKCTVKDNE